jgi:arylformamidase
MLYDITRPIEEGIAVWPGDTAYSHAWSMRIDAGDAVNVSALTLSAHTGTHADAPLHFEESGLSIGAMPLAAYVGPATVLVLDTRGAIEPDDLRVLGARGIERLLIKTPASLRPNDRWEDEFAYLSPAAAEFLVQRGVRLFGTDASSVDHVHSKTLDAHHILGRATVAILEGLALADVPPGDYELIALPLRLGVDGSPVRAVLRTLDR